MYINLIKYDTNHLVKFHFNEYKPICNIEISVPYPLAFSNIKNFDFATNTERSQSILLSKRALKGLVWPLCQALICLSALSNRLVTSKRRWTDSYQKFFTHRFFSFHRDTSKLSCQVILRYKAMNNDECAQAKEERNSINILGNLRKKNTIYQKLPNMALKV